MLNKKYHVLILASLLASTWHYALPTTIDPFAFMFDCKCGKTFPSKKAKFMHSCPEDEPALHQDALPTYKGSSGTVHDHIEETDIFPKPIIMYLHGGAGASTNDAAETYADDTDDITALLSEDTPADRLDCPHCSYFCSNLGTLTHHINHIHRGNATGRGQYTNTTYPDSFKYTCDFPSCSFRAKDLSKLKEHSRIHTGERKYKCPYGCSPRYICNRASNLTKHIKNSHDGAKAYICEYCPEQFETLEERKPHHKTHKNP